MPNGNQNPQSNVKAPKKKNFWDNIFFYLLIIAIGWALISAFGNSSKSDVTKPFSNVIGLALQGKVRGIEVAGDTVTVTLKDSSKFDATKESNVSVLETLQRSNVDLNNIPDGVTTKTNLPILDLLLNFGPIILMGALLFFFFRRAQGGASDILSFGRSKAKLFIKDANKEVKGVTFGDVAGSTEAKRELTEVVDFLKFPEKYRKLGARIPKGVLLIGPPGVGKTMLAKAVANEAGVPFFSMAGSEFMEMLVGVGASRVRDLFDTAKKAQPSLIFIDEVESIGKQRGGGMMGGHDEREQTLNQILVEMDGFDTRTNVIVIAATNRPDMLDSALLRPGRFDRTVTLELPDLKEREEIIKIHMRGKPFTGNVSVEHVAQQTSGFSGADLENMLNEAAILAARNDKKEIDDRDLTEASLKVKLGPERRRLQSDEDKKVIAYHEAGHALVSSQIPGLDPVTRVSIVARGMALGFTQSAPLSDRRNESKTRLLGMITSALGGRSAEELVFGEVTTGASNDIEVATALARRMVTEFGMSELGPVSFDNSNEKMLFPFGDSAMSEETKSKVDKAVKKIVDDAHERALELLTTHREKLDKIVAGLVEKETLEAEDFKVLIG
ncbi:MAG: ATP-dependent zinc metalloprotease FtsH [candidate division WWE3 bacterium]|nr:ATP-dependent zinc metalloprotease FtsH [candidate division WWE3 bacterium]